MRNRTKLFSLVPNLGNMLPHLVQTSFGTCMECLSSTKYRFTFQMVHAFYVLNCTSLSYPCSFACIYRVRKECCFTGSFKYNIPKDASSSFNFVREYFCYPLSTHLNIIEWELCPKYFISGTPKRHFFGRIYTVIIVRTPYEAIWQAHLQS